MPGQVWWCDGVALGWEAHFKRRPVLLLARVNKESASSVGDDAARFLVLPLSSRRRFGQERAVTHEGGVSYFSDRPAAVSAAALLSPLGTWDGFAAWRAEQERASEAAGRAKGWLARLKTWLAG